jgi:hypothetical protein
MINIVGLSALFATGVVLAGARPSAVPRPDRAPAAQAKPAAGGQFHDSHFHLTNYVQEGTDVRAFV